MYTCVNDEGEPVQVFLDGSGATVKTIRKNKPDWYECVDYNKNGEQAGVWYQPVEQAG
jgi:hypothetical protein